MERVWPRETKYKLSIIDQVTFPPKVLTTGMLFKFILNTIKIMLKYMCKAYHIVCPLQGTSP